MSSTSQSVLVISASCAGLQRKVLLNASKVVIHMLERNRVAQVIKLLAETVRQARERSNEYH